MVPFENARGGINPFREVATLARLIQIYRRDPPTSFTASRSKPTLYDKTRRRRLTGSPRVSTAIVRLPNRSSTTSPQTFNE